MAHNYAIITLGGKQYVVHEGETLLVDRLDREEGKAFQPDVLFVGGEGDGELSPSTSVSAKVVGHVRGPKVRIGKYKPKSGYRRHTGFRSSLTRIEITGIGGTTKTEAPAKKQEPAPPAAEQPVAEAPAAEAPAADAPAGLPEGYADMTVAQIAGDAKNWDPAALEAAQAYEQEHAKRKGALAALDSALEMSALKAKDENDGA
ncbi:MAG: 50S ribosomal protein L21 [Gaiellaceae bacterium]